jgi:microcompartment protein CcmK/EutM
MHPTATLDTTLISLRTQYVATLGKAVKRNRLRYEGIHMVQVDAVGAGPCELVLLVAQSDTQARRGGPRRCRRPRSSCAVHQGVVDIEQVRQPGHPPHSTKCRVEGLTGKRCQLIVRLTTLAGRPGLRETGSMVRLLARTESRPSFRTEGEIHAAGSDERHVLRRRLRADQREA